MNCNFLAISIKSLWTQCCCLLLKPKNWISLILLLINLLSGNAHRCCESGPKESARFIWDVESLDIKTSHKHLMNFFFTRWTWCVSQFEACSVISPLIFAFRMWLHVTYGNSSPKNASLLKMNSPKGHHFSCDHNWRNLALQRLFTNWSSAVNGCRQNEGPNSW